ncbi:MAG TPA: carbohydrate kinase family protein [Candidatus Altiarchaeales archaeon]|nr:carbohydrate kinase family protein [Candidatus Altiarchaeales archaeon]
MDVIGFGALNLDRLYRVERLAREGEHVEILKFEEFPGGSAANTIAGLARLGLDTGFIGAIGNDSEGKILLDDFRNYGVNTDGISILEGRTGIVIGFVDSRGERTLYPYPGVNSRLEFKNELVEYSKNTRYLHLSSFVNDRQLEVQKRLVALLPESVKVSFSPGILYSRRGLSALLPIIERSSIVFLNASEIRAITGKDYKEGSHLLIEKGAKMIAITLGDKGCYLRDTEGEYRVMAESVDVVDTTGAGDAFSAGFLYGLISGRDIVESGRLGNRVAAMCIQRFGARAGLPTREEV